MLLMRNPKGLNATNSVFSIFNTPIFNNNYNKEIAIAFNKLDPNLARLTVSHQVLTMKYRANQQMGQLLVPPYDFTKLAVRDNKLVGDSTAIIMGALLSKMNNSLYSGVFQFTLNVTNI